ncbi:MAG: MHYT domain-containing protein [Pseudomonadota bacterium]|nr:MHYT domain-containing protein [Pseudomonadota bacterium]
MGLSIWSMHFVAMLGFDPGSAVRYDPQLTLLSLLVAILATGGAFLFAADPARRRTQLLIAGAAMGVGICSMHYIGMAALRTAISFGYDPALVVLSLVIAIAASIAAILIARKKVSMRWQIYAAGTLGAAIVGMHYTAMGALRLRPTTEAIVDRLSGAPPYILAFAVAAGTIMVLFLALLASLHDQRANVLAALEAGGIGYWELDFSSKFLQVSSKGQQLLGFGKMRHIAFDDFLNRLSSDDRSRSVEAFASSLRTGVDFDEEYRLAEETRWLNIRGRRIMDGHRNAGRMIGIVIDVTDRQEAFSAIAQSDRRQRLLIDELNHRVKNTLATIQSIARQTARSSETVADFQKNFEARLVSLSATHNALTQGRWEAARLHDLFAHEAKPYSSDQFRLAGPDVVVTPNQALSLGMVIHELATNAAKYGALSKEGGCVSVEWQVNDSDQASFLVVVWDEKDGPPVDAPKRNGFGSRLIESCIVRELAGTFEINYAPTGVQCSLQVPLYRKDVSNASSLLKST